MNLFKKKVTKRRHFPAFGAKPKHHQPKSDFDLLECAPQWH
jgi:hypothetical protein